MKRKLQARGGAAAAAAAAAAVTAATAATTAATASAAATAVASAATAAAATAATTAASAATAAAAATANLAATVAEINVRTLRMETALFGPPEQPGLGAILRIESRLEIQASQLTEVARVNAGPRLDTLDQRMWAALIAALASCAAAAWSFMRGLK